MIYKINFKKIIICILLILPSILSAQGFGVNGIIAPVKLIAGQPDTLVVSDLFYSDDYNIKFVGNEKIKSDYDKQNLRLIFTADSSFEGITTVDFKCDNNIFSIPIYSKRIIRHKFIYKTDKKIESVYLFGSFNNWNREQIKLKDVGDGVFESEITLEPGRYEYKFIVDGDEVLDPENSEKIPNGIGGINSVLEIKNPHSQKIFLHKKSYNSSTSKNVFNFYLENENNITVNQDNVFVFIDNNKLNREYVSISQNDLEISVPAGELKGSNMLRAVVSINGLNSNLQMIPLQNGKPLDGKKFTWYDGIIYSLMIDRFNDGDKNNDAPVKNDSVLWKANYMGGDFAGITQKINNGYFDSLGVNTLWISPVNDNPNDAFKEFPAPHRWYTGYHGYWPISFTKVEEKFGTFDELKNTIGTAHKHNIKILLDYASHHVHAENPYFKNHRSWFGKLELPDGRLNLRLFDEYRLTTWFEPYMPSFDFIHSKDALNFMSSNAVWWLRQTGADGFRHDAVKHVPNIFWRSLTKKLVKEIEIPTGKPVYQIGETFGNYDLVNSYVNNGQLSAQFNFELYNTAQAVFIDPKRSFNDLDVEMKKSLDVFGPLHLMGNIMDSHDKIRFMAYADNEVDLSQWNASEEGWKNPPVVKNPYSYKKAELYYAYMFSIPGLPVIYYGSEFGMTGLSDPDNRRMMRFGNQLSIYEKEMLGEVRKIVKVRNENTALRYGDFYTLLADGNYYAFIRSDFYERVLVVLNKTDEKQNIEIELPEFYLNNEVVDLIEGISLKINSNKIIIELEPRGYKFYKIK